MLPNFLVIGAMKAGTTSLHYYLGQHPEVYMSPIKEPRFFAYEGKSACHSGPRDDRNVCVTDLSKYHKLFEGATDSKAIGECSTLYLYDKSAPYNIKRHIPEAKMIAVLRNPVERAWSHYLFNLRDGWEDCKDFAQAIRQEKWRIEADWGPRWVYLGRSYYSTQLETYFELFGHDHVKIYFYEDFCNNPLSMLKDIFRFLEVDDTFVPDITKRYNKSVIPKSQRVNRILNKVEKKARKLKLYSTGFGKALDWLREKNRLKPVFSPELRSTLVEEYREEITRLQKITGRDLSGWLK